MSELLLAACQAQARLCQNLQDQPLGRGAWNRLLQNSETRTVFLTWQWLSTWWECFSEGASLFTFAVERDGELIGIAPLMVRRQEGSRDVEFLGMGSSDYCDFIAAEADKPDVVQAVVEALLKRRDRWDRVRLRYVPSHSSTSSLLAGLALPEGWEQHSEVEASCPALSLEASPAFAQACTKKKSLVRHTRYFERLAPLEFHHAMDVDEILDRLPDFFEQHRDRRFMAGDISLFDDPRHRRFYERMVPVMLESNWLRFAVLRWRNESLGYHLGFQYDNVFTWYKPTFNVDYARYSPGEVLLQKLLEEAIESRVRLFDFTVGDESFKERFTNLKRQNVCVQIVQKRRRSIGRDEVKRYVKQQHPQLFGQLKTMHERLRTDTHPAHRHDWVSTRIPGVPIPLGRRLAPFSVRLRILWRAAPMQPVPSEFRAQWARYSDLKTITRREGQMQGFLQRCLARMRAGERAVVASMHDRPVALLWLARDAVAAVEDAGVPHPLSPGAALVVDSYLANDLRGSPRRETLMPALLTFLAAEGVTALYGLEETGERLSLPAQCGATLVPLVRRTQIQLLFWSYGYLRHFSAGADAPERT